ncbi:DUF202 domain-containing protein [Salarchaeum sp. JOR-1]|uniref:DUF202 domain-containing protein n=1 Tax=Salarchaeum sp. JOR-1 TaxID=2599399 RepID=UPI0011985477|nr:DUF202 domain-containing protein [Salarchaeum sp. JOR-1]QDX39457.1 DUF202 domain-containing protein [Salarchaeum sp. JOR-1]
MTDDEDDTATSLASERTRLARERTILAHIRTGFASFLFGVAVLGLFSGPTALLGVLFLGIGVLFLVTGWLSYLRSNRRVSGVLEEIERPFRRR